MPTYEYACRDCGEQLEVVQAFTDDPLTECPSCRGELRKVFSPVGISFKGSGFYKTDSRPSKSDSKGTSSSKESKDSGSGGSKSDSKSESKSDSSSSASTSSGSTSSSSTASTAGTAATG